MKTYKLRLLSLFILIFDIIADQENILIRALIQKDDSKNTIEKVSPLEDSHYIYVNSPQLNDNSSNFVYFYIYRMGKNNLLFWGAYNRKDKKVDIVGACKYKDLKVLNKALSIWKQKGFIHAFSQVKNRSGELINLNLANKDRDQYFLQKALIAVLRDELSEKDFLKVYKEEELNKFKKYVKEKASKEEWPNEEDANLFVLDKIEENLDKDFKEIKSIDNKFSHKVLTNYPDYEKLKANLDLGKNKIKTEQYKEIYPLKVYERFVENFKRKYEISNFNKEFKKYLEFIEKKIIIPYEQSLNRNDIKKDIIKNEKALKDLEDLSSKCLEILSSNKKNWENISNICPNFEECEKNMKKSCEIFHYGISVVHPEDTQLN